MNPSIFLALAIAFTLAGCSSLQNAGNAEYSVQPFIDAQGNSHCCAVRVVNGKEIASLEAHVSRQGDNFTIDLKEQGVSAFQGQAIAAGALQAAIESAVKAAVALALAPLLPALLPTLAPAAGAALASPGIGAAAVGAAGTLGAETILAPAKVKP